MGQPIIRHQGLGFLLADMQTHTDAARALLYPVWEKDTQWTWFLKNSRRFSEQMFLIDEGYISTYGDMLCLVRQISGGLYTCGLRPGDGPWIFRLYMRHTGRELARSGCGKCCPRCVPAEAELLSTSVPLAAFGEQNAILPTMKRP